MSAQQNSKICFRITKLLTWVKRGWRWLGCKTMSNVYFIPSFKQEGGYIIWGTPIILDGLHPLFVSRPVSVFSFGSAHSNALDVLPQQRRV